MSVEEFESSVSELAKLDIYSYAQKRKSVAKDSGVRMSDLDEAVEAARSKHYDTPKRDDLPKCLQELEPWPKPVDGRELFDEILAALEKHVILPAGAASVIAFWILHTHCIDAFEISPFLIVSAPEKRSGKSTTMKLLSQLVYRPLYASNVTPAALFRTIEQWQPTLLIDEADTFVPGKEELRGILDCGHDRGTAYVLRCIGDNHEPKQFGTFGPKAVAGIGKLPETILDRGFVIPMRRKKPEEITHRLKSDDIDLRQLARKIRRWAMDNLSNLKKLDPELPEFLSNRVEDNWRSIFMIAETIGNIEIALSAATILVSQDEPDESSGNMLLSDIREVLNRHGEEPISSKDLCSRLTELEHRPWGEWKVNEEISPVQLAALLKLYSVKPKVVRIGNQTPRGYSLKMFENAFADWLPPRNATPQQVNKDAWLSAFDDATMTTDVAGPNTPEPVPSLDCCNVAGQSWAVQLELPFSEWR